MVTPAIAVIIPAFNAGRFLNDAINSVLAQTITQWECVVVDDGSSDDTSSKLTGYHDERIRSVRQDHAGESAARLGGFSLTRARKIVFLDADDRLLPDALARYVRFLDNNSAVGVVYGERTLIDVQGRQFGFGCKALFNKCPQGDVLESILRRPFLSTPSQACLRREAVHSLEYKGPMADWVLLTSAAVTHKFAYVGRAPVVEYRVWSNSALRSLSRDSEPCPSIPEFRETLNYLFSSPLITSRFGATKVAELRRAAQASCYAMKGQEFLRRQKPLVARRYFSEAIRAGSRDSRDVLCWAATFSPVILRWTGPLFGVIDAV